MLCLSRSLLSLSLSAEVRCLLRSLTGKPLPQLPTISRFALASFRGGSEPFRSAMTANESGFQDRLDSDKATSGNQSQAFPSSSSLSLPPAAPRERATLSSRSDRDRHARRERGRRAVAGEVRLAHAVRRGDAAELARTAARALRRAHRAHLRQDGARDDRVEGLAGT